MTFGRTVRRLRKEQNVSIAEFARKVGMSPTYLAPIERDVFPPPAEPKIVRIARALGRDPDEFLALAGRVGSDLRKIIRRQPVRVARLLRAVDGLAPDDLDQLVEKATTRPPKTAKLGLNLELARSRPRYNCCLPGGKRR